MADLVSLCFAGTGSTLPAVRARHGDFPEWVRRGLGWRRDQVDVVDAAREPLPVAGAYAGLYAKIFGDVTQEKDS